MMELTREEMEIVTGGKGGRSQGDSDRDWYASVAALESSSTGTAVKNLIRLKKSQSISKETTVSIVVSSYSYCASGNVLSDFVNKWWNQL